MVIRKPLILHKNAPISSGVSRPISKKLGMVNLFGPQSVVVEPEF